MRLRVVLQEVSGNAVDLHGQLACRGYDERARAVARHELGLVQQLQTGHQERQRLARPCRHPSLTLLTAYESQRTQDTLAHL